MKLFYSKTSPYSRKAVVTIIEKNLSSQVELALCTPFAKAPDLQKVNPLGKIPTLVHDDLVLYDSPVVCEYLDSLHNPWLATNRFCQLKQAALADGVIDAALSIVLENRRIETQRSADWMDRQMQAIERSLPVMQMEQAGFSEDVLFAQVAFACALGYLDFRLPDFDWRKNTPELAKWFGVFSKRKSMIESMPPKCN